MEITKLATTINEQISILRTRGMIIEDEKKAIENLLDIGYYRLGFYWFPFEKSYPRKHQRNHLFKEGTKFDYAIKGKVLYNMTLPEAISAGPLGYLGKQKTKLIGTYKVFSFLLGKISQNRVTEMKAELLKAFDRVTYPLVKEVIYNNSGFRENEI